MKMHSIKQLDVMGNHGRRKKGLEDKPYTPPSPEDDSALFDEVHRVVRQLQKMDREEE
jgi:hypothetical protein